VEKAMTLTLDHILLGAPDLDSASDAFAAIAGVTPSGGGSHPGFGTRNRLLSLGEELFFEIIAPDPAQAEHGARADELAGLTGPAMHTFCLRSTDLAGVAARARAEGLATRDPVAMSRTRADGVRLAWEILYLDTPHWGRAMPFVIDWKSSPHPAGTSPGGCAVLEFAVLHPDAPSLAVLYARLGISVPVRAALVPGFLLRLETPRGEVMLT
jgi:hypothetical protein